MHLEAAEEYLRSLNEELNAQSKRVRNLIGDAHWLSDGRHKESLVAASMQRFLSSNLRVLTGFVTNPNDIEQRSKELDVLVVDVSMEQPLFEQFGFCVCAIQRARAAVSIKSGIKKRDFKNTLQNLNSVNRLSTDQQVFLSGIFFDEHKSVKVHRNEISRWVRDDDEIRDLLLELSQQDFLLCSTKNLLIRLRKNDKGDSTLCVYDTNNMAFAHFISQFAAFNCKGSDSTLMSFLDSYEVSNLIDEISL